MKKQYTLLWVAIFLFSVTITAQSNQQMNASFIGTATSVEYVTSMASRPQDLTPVSTKIREAKDKRSIANQIAMGQDPQVTDDYFVINKNQMEQSITRAPASLVFDTYSSNSQPTDPSIAVGPNHVMVVYNTGFMIYDKSGNQLQGETSPNPAIFPAGGCCDLTASYDNQANRWVLTFLGSGAQVAVSDGPNPLTSGWYIYTIGTIQDYQKLSIWSDGYYITENTSGSNKVWAIERSAMLAGNPGAKVLGFDLPGIVTSGFFSPQVLNVTDSNLPASGGATVVYMQDDAWNGVSTDHIKLWTIDVDWNNTANSTISSAQQINTTPFISVFDNGSFSNLTQPGGGSAIDALQATIMNQAQFRKFGTHNSAVFNFVVDADATSAERAAVRWIEFRQSADNQPWSLYQEGTYTAPDGRHAWNASIAMDGQGNMGMGYTSMSSGSSSNLVRVSSYFTGRSSSDPLGTMTSAEALIANGNGNFSGTRYGDYSKIDVDPSDDSSFWFINEYINNSRRGVVGKFQIQAGPPDTEDPTDPTNLVASGITSNAATLSWSPATDNVGVALYTVRLDGAVIGTSGTTSFNVTGLNSLTAYNASVVAQDASGNTSGAATTSFTTLDGPTIPYCDSASTNVNDEYISNVQINTINNSSGAQFYSDFTAISTNLSEGESYTISVTPTWTGTIYQEGYAAWIDYNNDSDFDDPGELVWSKSPSTDTSNTGSFTVPSGTSEASVRLRVSMKYNGIPTSCETFTWGEVEDYTINLGGVTGGDTEAPSVPINLTASNETINSVDIAWSASTDNVGVTGYEVFLDGTSIATTTNTTATVTGLSLNTDYAFNVRAFDAAGNNSVLSNTANATTLGDTQAPTIPINLIAFNETSNTVDISWNASSDNIGVAGYEYFLDGSSVGTTTSTSVTVTGLSENTAYSFNVRAFDAVGNNSALSNTANASTNGDTQAPSTPLNLAASNETTTTVDLSWSSSSDNVGVTGYEIFMDGTSLGNATGTTATVTGLLENTTYAFTVRAFDAAGNNSAMSNTANASTTGGGGAGVIAGYYFENGRQGWSDPGSDCRRISGSNYAFEGSYSMRLRDNSSTSNTQSPALDLSGNNQITFEFNYYPRSMENGEDFFVEFFDGSSYQVIGQYIRGVDFNNNRFYNQTIVLDAGSYNFNSSNRFRFRNDASGNNDYVYFDQIIISGDNVIRRQANPTIIDTEANVATFTGMAVKNIRLYPNPAASVINIDILEGTFDSINVYSVNGSLVKTISEVSSRMSLDVSTLSSGMYFVRFASNGFVVTKRFVKK